MAARADTATIAVAEHGTTPDGRAVRAYTLTNGHGVSMKVLDYGATVVSVKCPRGGGGSGGGGGEDEVEEVTLCSDDLAVLTDRSRNPYCGATVGRYANRIAGGTFVAPDTGAAVSLAVNNGTNHLHGGWKGWDAQVWRVLDMGVRPDGDAFVTFGMTSPDGDEGYPGTVEARAVYSLSSANDVGMRFTATVTGRPTPINMCNHAYWNLVGGCARDVKDHTVRLCADAYVVVDTATQIPTGELRPVAEDEPFDFTAPKRVGADLMRVHGGGQPGYDHSWVVVPTPPAMPTPDVAALWDTARALHAKYLPTPSASSPVLRPAAVVEEGTSHRWMQVFTTQPCIHMYTSNFMEGEPPFRKHGAMCLETHVPANSPNNPLCGTCFILPGQTYDHLTVHRLGWKV